MKKILIWSFAGIVIIGGAYFLFFNKKEEEKEFSLKPQLVSVSRGNLLVSVSATGKIEPIQTVELRSKASGEIINLTKEEGDFVRKGDLIAQLDQTTAQNEYNQAKADLDVAKVTYEQNQKELKRQQELYDKKLISEQEFEKTKLEYEKSYSQFVRAEAALSLAEEKLRDTVIRSPIDGLILSLNVEEGQVISSGISNVSGGTLMATVANLGQVYVKAAVDETDIGQVKLGQSARVIADAYPEEEFYGKVLRIAPLAQVDQNVTTFQVTSKVNNSSGLLKAGMNATIEIIIADKKDVLLIPNEALKVSQEIRQFMMAQNNPKIQSDPAAFARSTNNEGAEFSGNGKKKFVLLSEGGKFVPRRVEIGAASLDFSEVTSGLKENEQVLATPVSMMMQDREKMMERMRRWNQLPGMQRK